jgi:hypothetical protein
MTAPTEGPGARRDHRPRKSFWARFSEQETGPQKILVGLAGTMTALATTIGGIYALTNVVRDDPQTVASDPNSNTPTTGDTREPSTGLSTESAEPTPAPTTTAGVTLKPGQTLVAQGSKEADALVHAFVDDPGKRVELNVVILAESLYPTPQWIMRLWYNCHDLPEGQPPGEDLCDNVMLVFDDQSPSPPDFDAPRRIELRGIWADNRPTGEGYGARGLAIFPVKASF